MSAKKKKNPAIKLNIAQITNVQPSIYSKRIGPRNIVNIANIRLVAVARLIPFTVRVSAA